MLLSGENIYLLPFEPENWSILAGWFHDKDYQGLFRYHVKIPTVAEFQSYPAYIGAEVMMIYLKETNEIIGLIQGVPDPKPNRSFFLGLLIDKKFQKKHIPEDALILFLNYKFNRQQFNKVEIDILEDNSTLKHLMEYANFTYEGTTTEGVFMNGNYHNELRFCMLAKDFYSSRFAPKGDK